MSGPHECTCEATCCCEPNPESGWVDHDGGPNPVPGQSAICRVKTGETFPGSDMARGNWRWEGGYSPIIAYRVVTPAPASPEPVADRWADLERLAKAATPGDLDSADHKGEGSYECPCCNGDGQVEGKTFTNFDGYAIGVQFFGVGNEFTNYEAFSRAANPAAILELIATARQQPNREG